MLRTLTIAITGLVLALPGCKKDAEPKAAETPDPAEAVAADPVAPEAPAKPVEPEAPTKLVRADFTAPIPAGYKILPDETLADIAKEMGQTVDGVLTKPRAAPDHFVTSVVFTVVESTEVEPTTVCTEAAEAMAKAAGATAQAPKEIEFPFGKTCQFQMGDEKQQAIQTIAFVDKKFWTVTCNFDPRDEASPKECNEILTGFAAK
jgi:hypothetical protein